MTREKHQFDVIINGMSQNRKNIPEIFRKFPSSNYKSSVVHHAHLNLEGIELGYAEAARRIANSMNGQGSFDDLVLIPFMFLWRHAIELTLKVQIRHALALRAWTDLEGASSELKRLESDLGSNHNLQKLSQELANQFSVLGLSSLPAKTQKSLAWLAQSDPTGQAFRYAGNGDNDQSHIDFPALSKEIESVYEMVSIGADILSEYEGNLQDQIEEQRFVEAESRAEFEAEMRAEYEAEMRAEYGSNISW